MRCKVKKSPQQTADSTLNRWERRVLWLTAAAFQHPAIRYLGSWSQERHHHMPTTQNVKDPGGMRKAGRTIPAFERVVQEQSRWGNRTCVIRVPSTTNHPQISVYQQPALSSCHVPFRLAPRRNIHNRIDLAELLRSKKDYSQVICEAQNISSSCREKRKALGKQDVANDGGVTPLLHLLLLLFLLHLLLLLLLQWSSLSHPQ